MMHSIEAKILIHAPVAECYRRWLDVERFPEFMRRVSSVRRLSAAEMLGENLNAATWSLQKNQEAAIANQVVHEVKAHGGDVWHWEVQGPFGRIYSFNAGLVLNVPEKVISWSSTPDQEMPTTGTVNFLRQPGDSQTWLEVKMSYSAPAPPFGELIADITRYGDDVVNESLRDFQSYVEREVGGDLNPAYRTHEEPLRSEKEYIQQVGAPVTRRP